MKIRITKSEHGQAVVLLVFAMIALLGFTALAVDGSMVYSDRRFAQNGGDASSLAGGAAAASTLANSAVLYHNWPCSSPTTSIPSELQPAADAAKVAARNRGADNSFTIDIGNTDPEDNLIEISCGAEGTGLHPDKYMDIRTRLHMTTQTAFAHFVYGGIMRNTVEAVTRIQPPENLGWGHAVVALNPKPCAVVGVDEGISFQGDSDTLITDGGVFTNGCLQTRSCISGPFVDIEDANVVYHQVKQPSDLNCFDLIGDTPGTKTQTSEIMPSEAYTIDEPDCSQARYTGSWPPPDAVPGSPPRDLAPGLYCIDGGITINTVNESFSGTDITIYLRSGPYAHNGGTVVALAPDPFDGTPPVFGAVEGLILYVKPVGDCLTNTAAGGAVTINGNSTSRYRGTILAPTSTIKINGVEEGFLFQSQVIGCNVKVAGTANTNVLFNNFIEMMWPTNINLWR